SIRRHVRLVDYFLHEGCSARAWVHLTVNRDLILPSGTALFSRVANLPGVISPDTQAYREAVAARPVVFETLEDAVLRQAHNAMSFYTWGYEACCLPKGATQATLRNPANQLQYLNPGAVLIFEEVIGP